MRKAVVAKDIHAEIVVRSIVASGTIPSTAARDFQISRQAWVRFERAR